MKRLAHGLGWIGLLGTIATLLNGAAIATVPSFKVAGVIQVANTAILSPKAEPSAAADTSPSQEFQTYTLPEVFAIQMPEGWFAVGNATQRSATLTSYDPNRTAITDPQLPDVLTEIVVVDENPNTFVKREIDGLIQGDRIIDSYGYAAVDGQTAFRVWILESPLPDFTRQVITFVGYGDVATVTIVTHYNNPDPATAEAIVAMHRSFQRLP